jgi:hypothetical protein
VCGTRHDHRATHPPGPFHEKARVCQCRRRGGGLRFAFWSWGELHVELVLASIRTLIGDVDAACMRGSVSSGKGAAISMSISFRTDRRDLRSHPTSGSRREVLVLLLCCWVLFSSGLYRLVVWGGQAATDSAEALNNGTYTAPVIHSRCITTASLRATAMTARFFAFFPPRLAMAKP